MYKKLKELLLTISHLSLKEQKNELFKSLIAWKGPAEQVDDILLIGIKIN